MRSVLDLGRNLVDESEIRSSHVELIAETMKRVEERWRSIEQLIKQRKAE